MDIVDQMVRESAMRQEDMKTGFMRVNPRDLDEGVLDELLVGPMEDDGDMGEGFNVVWTMLGGRRVAQIRAFADSWSGLLRCTQALRALPEVPADAGVEGHPSIEQVMIALKDAGGVDHTRPPLFPRKGDRA